MGAEGVEAEPEAAEAREAGRPPLGIGEGSRLRRVIVDKDARIGREVVVEGVPDRPDEDGEHHCVRDGIVVLRKGAVLSDGTRI
jgi:glucose-1-phosphate adenylyltransferase